MSPHLQQAQVACPTLAAASLSQLLGTQCRVSQRDGLLQDGPPSLCVHVAYQQPTSSSCVARVFLPHTMPPVVPHRLDRGECLDHYYVKTHRGRADGDYAHYDKVTHVSIDAEPWGGSVLKDAIGGRQGVEVSCRRCA